MEHYCPLKKIRSQWKDRKKIIFEPLFKGYVFIRNREQDLWEATSIPGVLNYVYLDKKPATVRDEEIETIQKFLNEFDDVELMSGESIVENQLVQVTRGVLMNYRGIVLNLQGNKARVYINSMGVYLCATFEVNQLMPL
jgi:transcription antitermination factor NusG